MNNKEGDKRRRVDGGVDRLRRVAEIERFEREIFSLMNSLRLSLYFVQDLNLDDAFAFGSFFLSFPSFFFNLGVENCDFFYYCY